MSFVPVQFRNKAQRTQPNNTPAQKSAAKTLDRNAELVAMGKSLTNYQSGKSVPKQDVATRVTQLARKLSPDHMFQVLKGVNAGMVARGDAPLVGGIYSNHSTKV